MSAVKVSNWKRTITYEANSVETVRSVDEIRRIVRDRERYPSPVRVRGSHHSTTRCIVADGGTVVDVTRMNRILRIDREARTITMEPGVLHIDAALELERHGLQFYVNVEIGNLTVGSGACGGTKDASYFSAEEGGWEFGQVASYVIGMKVVLPDGSIREITEADGDLLVAMRSSYGMLGILVEVTYRVKPLVPMAVEHVAYSVDEFADRLGELIAGDRSMMMYLFPFLDRVVVESRYDGTGRAVRRSWQWKLRNWVWKTLAPSVGKIATACVPHRGLRYAIVDAFNRVGLLVMTIALRGCRTSPADQIIRYPHRGGFSAYTFSIWAFPREGYEQSIRDYYRFCKDHYARTGYRCDLLNVGYHIAKDRSSLFSYTRDGSVLTLDPVSTGSEGWVEFLAAYNEFCVAHDGRPLFNQSRDLTPSQARSAFGEEIRTFLALRRETDPDDRFYTDYFRRLFEEA